MKFDGADSPGPEDDACPTLLDVSGGAGYPFKGPMPGVEYMTCRFCSLGRFSDSGHCLSSLWGSPLASAVRGS